MSATLHCDRATKMADLSARRLRAAELSGGISDDSIYAAVEHMVSLRDLRGAVLDFGAGKGNFTRRLLALNRFDTVTGADLVPCPPGFDTSVQWLQQDLSQPLQIDEESFDLVIAAEIIEHLENPRLTMRELCRVLKPDGAVILTTPNNESLRSLLALVLRGHFVAFGDSSYPAHITALLRQDLKRIVLEAGFSEPEFCFTDVGGIPGLPHLKWQTFGFGLLRGLRFSDTTIAIAQKPARPRRPT